MIDFVGKKKIFFVLSLTLILGGLIYSLIFGVKLDIQFKGGSIITYSYQGNVDTGALEDEISQLTNSEITIQKTVDYKTNAQRIAINFSNNINDPKTVDDYLTQNHPDNQFKNEGTNTVDPVMGKEFLVKCLVAVVFAFLLILVYVWYRFKKIGGLSAGVMAIVALLHDISIVFFTFVVFGIPINDNFVAVVLTILGYSMNDTIVIYDRIRENRKLAGEKFSYDDLVNHSITQSLTRSINTAVAVFLSMLVIVVVSVVLNLDSILSFALPMLMGVISGSYSTICIAGPLWVVWQNHKQKKKALASKAAK